MYPKVDILVSTYNGARYLRELLESVLNQDYPSFSVLVRDDGSTDATVDIIREYAARDARVRLCGTGRRGVVGSFFELLRVANPDAQYFAFCDQDDWWYPTKIKSAVTRMQKGAVSGPQLYCSRVEAVDEHLQHLAFSAAKVRVGFSNAVVENIAIGCTSVLNAHARKLILEHEPEHALMHDWWCYLVVSALGEVIYDDYVGIKYRQHGGNVVGMQTRVLKDFVQRLSRVFISRRYYVSDQARELLRCFGDKLGPNRAALLRELLEGKGSFATRLRLSVAKPVYRQRVLDDFYLRCLILANRY